MEADQQPTVKTVLNTAHAIDMLTKRYAGSEWALMFEVAPKTGGGTRYADAVAVNLWSSRGHAIHGFEIKTSRSDWLRELKQPEKAEDVFQYCDYWWILAPKGTVKDGELPPTWGLLELRETGIVQSVAAPKLSPIPITRSFFASLMRRGHEGITAAAERMQRVAVDTAHQEIDKRVQTEIERRTIAHRELQDQIAKFTAETGIALGRWSATSKATIELAKRLEAVNGYGADKPFERITELASQLERYAEMMREAVAASGLGEPNA